MEEFAKIIANYGFPIAVATYLLIRLEQKIEKLTNAIEMLVHEIENKSRKR